MTCEYCDDTGIITIKEKILPCPHPDCVFNKEDAITVLDENDKPILSNNNDKMMADAKEFKQEVIEYRAKHKNDSDLLKYRFKNNGLLLFMYGPKEHKDKVIDRLREVIDKYDRKIKKKKTKLISTTKTNYLPSAIKNLLKP